MIKPSGIIALLFVLAAFTMQVSGATDTPRRSALKTSHKRYMVYPFQGQTILCEPYTVTKNDWLYKIFRKKGKISDEDFPLFLSIFQALNPKVSNIDAINPGQQIMIPLKRIDNDDYQETEPGIIDVPIIEFSSMPERLKPYMTRYKVRERDAVSRLLDKTFINRDGSLNQKGLLAFQLLNPTIDNPDLIYTGSVINIPASALASQPWFTALVRQGRGPVKQVPVKTEAKELFAPDPIARELLAAYARSLDAEAMDRGKLYIPRQGNPDMSLNLKTAPMLRKPDGSRILFVAPSQKDSIIIKAIQSFWPRLTLMDLKIAAKEINDTAELTEPAPADKNRESTRSALPPTNEAAILQLLEMTGFDYTPNSPLSFTLGGIDLKVNLGRVRRQNKPDLIINFGVVYGSAEDSIKNKGVELVSVLPRDKPLDAISAVFTALGTTITPDPAFIHPENETTIIIPGLYIRVSKIALFIAEKIIKQSSTDFLNNNNVRIIYTHTPVTKGA